jgi:hypothetical protein
MSYPASYRRILYRMGFYDYQQGLVYRYLRQGKGWIGHEQHCRDYILRAVEKTVPEKITVLGSGWLLDLPVAELAERGKEINLIDIIHPPEVKEQIRNLQNVKLVEDDISGGLIEETWRKSAGRSFLNRLKTLDGITIPEYNLDDPGLVISLNILTQLEAMPLRLLARKAKVPVTEINNFRKRVQEMHISLLRKHKSVLITDTAEIFTGSGNKVVEKTLLADMPEGSMRENWQWDFDLKKDDLKRKQSVMDVTAIII